MKRCAVTLLPLALFLVKPAECSEIIVHLASKHVITTPAPEGQKYYDFNETNPGLGYVGNTGWTVGGYYNSFRKATLYVGYTSPKWFGVSGSALVGTGYERLLGTKLMPMLFVNYDLTFANYGVKLSYAPGNKLQTFGLSLAFK